MRRVSRLPRLYSNQLFSFRRLHLARSKKPGAVHPVPAPILDRISSLLSPPNPEDAILREARSHPQLTDYLSTYSKLLQLVQALAHSADPESSCRLLTLTHALGHAVKQGVYENTAFHLASNFRWDAVLLTVSLGKYHTQRSTARLLNWQLRAFLELQNFAALDTILDEFSKYSQRPTRRTFHLLIAGYLRNRDLSRAKEVLRQMQSAGHPADPSTEALIVANYRSLGFNADVERHALQTIVHIENTEIVLPLINGLIQLRLDLHDVAGVYPLLAYFPQDIAAKFKLALAYHPIVASPATPPPWFHVVPDANTFSMFFKYAVSIDNLDNAILILETMFTSGIKPTTSLMSSLVHLYFRAGMPDVAASIVVDMCHNSSQVSEILHPLKLKLDESPFTLPLSTQPSARVFNALLHGLLRTHGFPAAVLVLRAMHVNGLKPNSTTLQIMIAYLYRTDRLRPPVLLRIMKSLLSPSVTPTVRHLHVILSSILRRERHLLLGTGWNVAAARYSRHLKRKLGGINRNVPKDRLTQVGHTFDPMTGLILGKIPRYSSLIRPILERLSNQGVRVDAPLTSLRMKRDANHKNLDSVYDILETVVARGIQPNQYHYSALMEAYASAGDLNSASATLAKVVSAGIRPNALMFTILIVGYARTGNPQAAMQTFQDMIANDVHPDVACIDAVTSSFFIVGDYVMARKTLITLWPYIQPFPQEFRSLSLQELARKFRLLSRTPDSWKQPSKTERIAMYRQFRGLLTVWQWSECNTNRLGSSQRSSTIRSNHARMRKIQF